MRETLQGFRLSRASDPAAERRATMAVVRSTGAQGGRIDPHRSIATIALTRVDVLGAIVLAAVTTLLYAMSLPLVGRLWTAIFGWLAGPLGLGGVGQRSSALASIAPITVPFFTAAAAPPGARAWWITLVVTLILVLCTIPMRGRWLPLGYALRFAAVLQASALLFFALWPTRFPYELGGYVSGMMLAGATLIGILPMVYGLTFYLMDVPWGRKVMLTLLLMAHLVVLVPLQYAVHSVLIAHASLVVLPVLFILFGLLPEVMVLVAFFGWGMSWRSPRARRVRL